ncbi:MAG: hypothetical protein ACREYE_19055 [Gammaproteobacteria bacterium]
MPTIAKNSCPICGSVRDPFGYRRIMRTQPCCARRGRSARSRATASGFEGAEGAQGVGPSWKDLAGTEVTLADGRTLVRDRGYLARAILDPDAEIAAGYPKGLMDGTMPDRQLTGTEIEALVLYHAVALSVPQTTLITADDIYYRKTQAFGAIRLLYDAL